MNDHPLALAAARAARAAAARAAVLGAQKARLRAGEGVSVGDLAEAAAALAEAEGRRHEARRRLVTQQLARANRRVVGQDFLEAARRLARLTLAEDVRGQPLDR